MLLATAVRALITSTLFCLGGVHQLHHLSLKSTLTETFTSSQTRWQVSFCVSVLLPPIPSFPFRLTAYVPCLLEFRMSFFALPFFHTF